MQVFQIKDLDRYQSLQPKGAAPIGMSRDDWWATLPFYLHWKSKRKGDFYAAKWDYLITSPRASELLREHFDSAGGVRPFVLNERPYAFVPVNRYLDVLQAVSKLRGPPRPRTLAIPIASPWGGRSPSWVIRASHQRITNN